MNESGLSFKPILLMGLKRGIIYSSVFAFVTTGWFVVIITVMSNESSCRVLSDNSTLEYYSCILASVAIAGVLLTVLAFIFIGFPLMIFPVALGSSLLCFWLYHDSKSNRLSLPKSRLKGALLGSISGLALGPIFFFRNASQIDPLALFAAYEFIDLTWRVGLFILPFIFGGMAGFLLATYLTNELKKGAASIKPKEEYFQIDWEALQKDAQQKKNDLTPDT